MMSENNSIAGNYFNNMINDYSKRYISLNGKEKYEKIQNKIYKSEKIANLLSGCEQRGIVPTSRDILTCLHTIPYFIFQSSYTCAMAALIVIRIWHNNYNADFSKCSFEQLVDKMNMVFSLLKID